MDTFIPTLSSVAPVLTHQIEELARGWLSPLLTDAALAGHRGLKTFTDPVWGTISLHPWEVALLDTPLVQRLRGVKQLGLAHLVFPSATHDRFSHVCGVVEGTERMMDNIVRNAKSRRDKSDEEGLPPIDDRDRYLIRLAALIHDIGHGPFSHAVEPVIQRIFEQELRNLRAALQEAVPRIGTPQVSEIIAVLTVISSPFQTLLSRPIMSSVMAGRDIVVVSKSLIAAILGGADGSGREALGALVSSQIDADKLDYMARDALHAGLPINFDTQRLIGKLEIVQVEEQVLSPRLRYLKERLQQAKNQRYFEIGIAAGGTGALEQMLVGRIFLYDRLYHHHKVRSADAMAQRLIYYADPEGKELSLNKLYAPLTDDMVIRAFGGWDFGPEDLRLPSSDASREIADAIETRTLYKRAFAFAGRFVAGLDTDWDANADDVPGVTWSEAEKDAERARVMDRANRDLAELPGRLQAEHEIATLAQTISQAFEETHPLHSEGVSLAAHHIIVDLPRTPHPPRLTTLARADDGRLDVPDVFYDPARWAAVYDTQRRTAYVFAHPRHRTLVSIAARIWFLQKFNCVQGEAAERHAKATSLIDASWFNVLETAGVLTSKERDYLQRPRLVFMPLELKDRQVPSEWRQSHPNFVSDFNRDFNSILPNGLSASAESELANALRGIFRTLQTWMADASFVTTEIVDEADLQRELRKALRQTGLDITEGEVRAGGETDLKAGQRVIIENKVLKDATDDPFQAVSRSGLQGRRYVLPTGQSFVITAVAYKAATESGKLAPSKCIAVRQLADVSEPFVEIRIVVRHSDSVPSRAKAAPKTPQTKRNKS